jgi:hypothetical protein
MPQDEHMDLEHPESNGIPADDVDVEQVLLDLNVPQGVLPVEAIRAAQQLGPRIVPGLMQLIRDATQDASCEREPELNGHFFALFLLISLRAKEAWPDILDAMTLPGDAPFFLYGDAIHEAIPLAVPALAHDRIEEIVSTIQNVHVNEYVRWSLIGGLANCVVEGLHSREETVRLLCGLLRESVAEKSSENVLPLALTLVDLCPREAREDVERAIDEDLLCESDVPREQILDAIELGEERALKELARQYHPVVDVVEKLRRWAAFAPERKRQPVTPVAAPRAAEFSPAEEPVSQTIRHEERRVGRNDPCPCGSGKKFKKCCARSSRE